MQPAAGMGHQSAAEVVELRDVERRSEVAAPSANQREGEERPVQQEVVEEARWDRVVDDGDTVAQFLEERRDAVPMKRYGTSAEIAATVAFLASAGAGYITGQNIRVDGGITRSV